MVVAFSRTSVGHEAIHEINWSHTPSKITGYVLAAFPLGNSDHPPGNDRARKRCSKEIDVLQKSTDELVKPYHSLKQ